LEGGYEGQMVRLNAAYENKRSKFLMKRKEFIDEEYVIVDIVEGEGNRAGTAGYMQFFARNGKSFKSNIKGSFPWLRQLLKDRKSLIGKKATIKYFNLTPDSIPRFGFVVAVRDYE
jgi:DNA ligase-1